LSVGADDFYFLLFLVNFHKTLAGRVVPAEGEFPRVTPIPFLCAHQKILYKKAALSHWPPTSQLVGADISENESRLPFSRELSYCGPPWSPMAPFTPPIERCGFFSAKAGLNSRRKQIQFQKLAAF